MLTVQQIAQTVSDYFKDKPVKEVYLFGSYARGEAKEDSDIDIGVIIDNKKMSLWEYIRIATGLEDILKKKVDMVEIEMMHSWVKRDFEKDKITLYSH